MSDIAIRVEHLSKRYRIARRVRHDMIRDQLADGIRGLFLRNGRRNRDDTAFWAVKDLSFQVQRGEVLGIIGRNGAGKSTLLKILSRVTEPTGGRAVIHGRTGSLLEVGAGFHMELTGRENVYLNGAILGMTRREIGQKFDEIIAFAEVEEFIDTPLKRYSSGMYVRLAFSVAAHLEPAVLLVDEVLAVGDARFWSKSMDKMRALNAQGMTIVLVTHNLAVVQAFCSRAICLERGRIVAEGSPFDAMAAYRGLNGALDQKRRFALKGRETARILACHFVPRGGWSTDKTASPDSGMAVVIAAQVKDVPVVRFRVRVANAADGFVFFTIYSDPIDTTLRGHIECEAIIPHLMLLPGKYCLCGAVCADIGETAVLAEGYVPFSVAGTGDSVHDETSIFWNHVHWNIRNECRARDASGIFHTRA